MKAWFTITVLIASSLACSEATQDLGDNDDSGAGGGISDDESLGGTGNPNFETDTPEIHCFNATNEPTETCAVEVTETTCDLGDANECLSLSEIEIYDDDGSHGVALHLIFPNKCAFEVYADVCVATDVEPYYWQCWTSSVLPGFPIDVSTFHATGEYFLVATASSGQLNIIEEKCPAPLH